MRCALFTARLSSCFPSNGLSPPRQPRPSHVELADTDVAMMERIAAGEATTEQIEEWLQERTAPTDRSR
ncbi:MAG TPA: hypothetical protein VND98_00880 [Solirubrobacterales bacterium]|nr:hypothetical protein [Solirubrobacterales bacterium]